MKKSLAVLMLLSIFVVAGCKAKTEKERYIDASVEATCVLFKSPDASSLTDKDFEKKVTDIFTKYGFDAKDTKNMEAIAIKYQNDAEVEAAVKKALESCTGDLMNSVDKLKDDGKKDDAKKTTGK